ncbi:DUF397 domain-containing protein [Streptomyces endophyticus]|uniref:DUF397 domain-containing protein n=1 Tax=Streptomyces endophyticus TaxID=714166 RepID=A0ABU6FBD6_9ACTN|nr:DUF397 domain-containing protein [Streptomyces endophyticus]MEB8340937.1 DUF397 domain-containing protein [Streptomyces endophyticus]
MTTADLTWFKSSYSGDSGGDCLEVAHASEVHIRDSKNAKSNSSPTLAISADSWTAFVNFAAKSALQ